MRIKENNKKNTVDYAKLKPGDCFRAWGDLFIKSQIGQTATGLKNGQGRCNMCGIEVTPVNAEIHIVD